MKVFYYHIYLISVFFLISALQGQAETINEKLVWTGVQTLDINGGQIHTLSFSGADNCDQTGLLPTYSKKVKIPAPGLVYEFSISDEKFAALENQIPISNIQDIDLIESTIKSWTENIIIRGQSYSVFKLLPLRKNPANGKIEKLISFQLDYTLTPGNSLPETKSRIYTETSVLAQGDWYKIAVAESGVYKVTWQQLSDMGMNVNGIESSTIRLFGNGGGMLPQKNSNFRFDDLQENAIEVVDGDDGTFDQGDYFLFYGQSPHNWTYNSTRKTFEHNKNLYTDLNYYFIRSGEGSGKRIQTLPQSPHPASITITTFNDYASHEMDERNLIKSGSEWYGEEFTDDLSQEFYFPFPNRDTSENVYVFADFAARANQVSHFTMYVNNDSIFTDNISALPINQIYKYANISNKYKWFRANIVPDLNVTLEYDKPGDNAKGWLNFIQINVMSHLRFNNQQFQFRNINSVHTGMVSQFVIKNTPENFRVWNITNPLLPSEINTIIQENECRFKLATDSILEFAGFDGSDFLDILPIGSIPNQNLHQYHTAEFIIVTHPKFLSQATRLKELHEELDDMDVIVATIDEIYNEFSSGAPDLTAIRDFVRMVYTRSGDGTSPALKYLLLFGDGSYDPKDRIDGNESYIPTFQSKQSLYLTSSYVTDDYFGLMDTNEGNDASGDVDLGIGRFPVNSVEEAEHMVDKVDTYMRMDQKVLGNWRNSMCFIADDEDNNLHIHQADTILIPRIQRENKSININKIYLDAYKQEYSASGYTYPEATNDFNKQVNAGTLIVNYTGHGGELGLADEKVLQINDIISWTNVNALPVFITATCEFSRFDNPILTSAGELVLLNKNGGGIALLTTTRLAFSTANLLLNKRIYDTLFRAYPETIPRLGDLIMFSKNPSTSNLRNFVLLGNPALPLALPQYNIVTDSINGVSAEKYSDTLNANTTVVVSGHIESFHDVGLTSTDFNGTIFPVLYDKAQQITTLGNDAASYPYQFDVQNNILCKGKASVKEGRFTFTFILPKDIAYQYGEGKLSYYATNSRNDAAGYFSQLIIGGNNGTLNQDNTGPAIELYLNDTSFINGTTVNPNPVFLAQLSDASGINFTGSGIGHDISLTINGDSWNTMNLNEYFQPTLDDYSSGTIKLPLQNFSNGTHTLELKAWDMFNNPSISTLEFIVSDSLNVNLINVYNFPNPFSDHTYFTFKHNQFDGDLSIEITIFDLYGQFITTIGPEKVFRNGYGIDPVFWNGTNSGGAKLRPGIYLYSLRVSNDKNSSTQRIQKMIITD